MSAVDFDFSYSGFDLALFDMGMGVRLLASQGRDLWGIPLAPASGARLRPGADAFAVIDGVTLDTVPYRVIHSLDLDGNGRAESLWVSQGGLPGFAVSDLRDGVDFDFSADIDLPVHDVPLGARVSRGGGGGAGERGTAGRDRLTGDGGDDLLEGLAGRDVLRGRGGDDRLDGGRGNDRLDGGGGKDRLEGGVGRDRLEGGAGKDRLEGGPGRDVFHFARGDGRRDVIEDWNRRADRIEIASGAERFGQLRFRDLGEDLLVRYGRDGFVLEDAERAELRRADVDFV